MHESPSNPNVPAPRSLERTAEGASVEDLALLQQIQQGDQEAMGAFYDRYSKMVYSVALRVLNDASEAEDVMQEVLVQVWRNPGAFVAGRGSLGGWLVVVARNRAVDKLHESGEGVGARHPDGEDQGSDDCAATGAESGAGAGLF
jgi:DNA-directed RNA polymerase specialized sigma24 family protein